MPRKAAAASTEATAEPRRSSRIKDQPKAEPVTKKAPAKPRAKKAKAAEAEAAPEADADRAEEPAAEKPKSSRGQKRKADGEDAEQAAAEVNGTDAPTEEGENPPPSKKACPS
jgi:hypothetical protein